MRQTLPPELSARAQDLACTARAPPVHRRAPPIRAPRAPPYIEGGARTGSTTGHRPEETMSKVAMTARPLHPVATVSAISPAGAPAPRRALEAAPPAQGTRAASTRGRAAPEKPILKALVVAGRVTAGRGWPPRVQRQQRCPMELSSGGDSSKIPECHRPAAAAADFC
jgi:hypothetical protein